MAIIAKKTGNNPDFIPAPVGTWSAVCVDVVDLGMLEVTYGGKTKKQHKVRIVWQIEEVMKDNRPYLVQRRYTCSLHEKAALRKDLVSWRGRDFTEDEENGFDLETIIGVACLLNVIQENKNGGTFANVAGVMRLPRGINKLQPRDYKRVKDREPEEQQREGGPPEDDYIPSDDDVPF